MKTTSPNFKTFFAKLTNRQAAAVIGLMLTSLGILDFWSGFEASFSFFYLFPISLGTWYWGRSLGLGLAALSVALWLSTNWLAGATYSHESIWLWNALIRLVFFIVISLIIDDYKEALEAATRLARTDALTGLLNSREFFRLAELELSRCQRYRHPLTMAYIDLDNFKMVNDQLGHNAGDRLIKLITSLIGAQLRRTDIFARMGGDEFALLLPETDRQAAENVITRIQAKLAAEKQATGLPTSFSLGAITFTDPPASVEEMLHRADALMYSIKAQGKNSFRVINQDEALEHLQA